MKELTLKEIQMGEFQILRKFSEICEEQGFRYFLAYGTLIGAVRHKGFIPWDDDIDVAMPREDYNKFLDYYEKNMDTFGPLELKHWRFDKKYVYPISRLSDNRYYVDYNFIKDYGLGLFIDIYPYDGCGNSREEAVKWYKKTQHLRTGAALASNKRYVASSKKWWRNIIKFPMYIYAKMRGIYYYLTKLDNVCQTKPYKENKFVYNTVWGLDIKDAIEREVFEEYTYLSFENCKFRVPVKYDYWLRLQYGDYMKLPPKEKQIQQHNYIAYIKNDENHEA